MAELLLTVMLISDSWCYY